MKLRYECAAEYRHTFLARAVFAIYHCPDILVREPLGVVVTRRQKLQILHLRTLSTRLLEKFPVANVAVHYLLVPRIHRGHVRIGDYARVCGSRALFLARVSAHALGAYQPFDNIRVDFTKLIEERCRSLETEP